MDFGKAFTFMFQDDRWLAKLGIGTLLVLVGIFLAPMLIGIVPLIIVTGYSLVALDNVRLGHEHPLPEWQDWGRFFMLGLKAFVALFVWALPLFLGFVPVLAGSVLSDNGNSNGAGAIAALLIICGSCMMFLWGLFIALLTPAIYARLAATGRLAAAFELGRIWEFTRDNLGNVIIAILLVWLAGIIAAVLGTLGFMLLCVGAILTIPLASLWQYLVQAHLFGQIAANSVTAIE
jgi:hypothetical protein